MRLFVPMLAMGGGLVLAQDSKLSTELRELTAGGSVNVIVQYNHDPNASDHDRMRSRGGVFSRQLDAVRGGAYAMPGSALNDLSNDSGVAHVSIDHPIHARLDYVTAATNANLAAQNFGATGTGIGVAVIDSGIAANSDFGSRIVYSRTSPEATAWTYSAMAPMSRALLAETAPTLIAPLARAISKASPRE